MSNKDSFAAVKGYHEHTPIPEPALEEGLKYRFAIVLDTFRPDLGYMHFAEDLCIELLCEIARGIDHDTLRMQSADGPIRESLDDLRDYWLAISQAEDDEGEGSKEQRPPRWMRFLKEGALTCFVEPEAWARCGGPQPYSDSWTLSFYTSEDLSGPFQKACFAVSERTGAELTQIIQASPVPIKVPRWKRFLRWLIR